MNTQLENLQRQLRISDQIDIIMKQTLELMDMVNRNQKEVNRLKAEIDELKTHQDNATDQLDDDGDKYRDADIMINQ
jgi:hypothetical protein